MTAECSGFVGGLPLAPKRPFLAAKHQKRHQVAPSSIATTGDSSRGSSGKQASGGGSEVGAIAQLLQGVWGWLNSLQPPKTLWRSIAALVLGGEALVRILQGVFFALAASLACAPSMPSRLCLKSVCSR